ncbi:hypothetical protein NUW58_g8824 [Xylaria curta]|uniref:Uncharacterized protein n=1 Tax=Xylaria curta TaxID=42375 RepID=A0ACC1N3P7_9PEZI|nr:hypothetical protein NUW58_g8824 [Xylaria curta]
MTNSRLRSPIDNAVSKRRPTAGGTLPPIEEKEDFVDLAVQEAVDPPTQESPTPFEVDVISFLHWSLDYNEGFVPSMMSTIRYAPLMEQHEYWRLLAKRKPGTTAVLIGRDDNLVQREDYEEDALPLIGGQDNVFWRIVPGAHNFPFTHPRSALKEIYKFWEMK